MYQHLLQLDIFGVTASISIFVRSPIRRDYVLIMQLHKIPKFYSKISPKMLQLSKKQCFSKNLNPELIILVLVPDGKFSYE